MSTVHNTLKCVTTGCSAEWLHAKNPALDGIAVDSSDTTIAVGRHQIHGTTTQKMVTMNGPAAPTVSSKPKPEPMHET